MLLQHHTPSLRGLELREDRSFMSFNFAESGFKLGHAPVLFPLTVTVDIVDSPHHIPIIQRQFIPPTL